MHLTPTETRILELLSDGKPHARREIHSLLYDDQGPLSNIQPHICTLRAKLRSQGEEIDCVLVNGRICYRKLRPLTPRTA